MDDIIQLDRTLFQFLNGIHNGFFDVIMYWLSNRFIWIPLYAFFIFLLFKKYQKKAFFALIGIALMITATDQTCNFFKHSVKRFRPCQERAQLTPPARTLENTHCGSYGFFSAHAANSFAIAIFMSGLLAPFFKRIHWLLIPWAAVIAYSRIYLGVHYPLDVICGTLCGIIYGWLFFKFTIRFLH